MNLHYTAMKNSISSRSSESNSLKRLRKGDSESDSETEFMPDVWPRFLVVCAKNSDQSFDKLSPFVVSKALKGLIGEAKDAKILRSGKVLVQCARYEQSVNLLKCKMFGHIPVEVSPHNTLNFCKGVIRSPDFKNASEQEMLEDLRTQHVTEVNRVVVTRNGNKIPTNTFILKFDIPTLPNTVKAALTVYPVEPFVPNPLRCFNCQRFGHHKDKCGRNTVCGRCGQEGHDLSSCENPLQCANCKGEHFAYSKECAKWKQEKEIQSVKVKNNLTFKEARKLVESRTPGGASAPSFADVARANLTQPKTQECLSCKLLLEKLCTVFPEKAEQIKQIVQDIQTNATTASKPVSQTNHPPSIPHSDAVPTPSSSSSSSSKSNHQTSPKKANTVSEKTTNTSKQSNKDKQPQKSPKKSSPKTPKKAKSNSQSEKEKRPKINRLISSNEISIAENRFSALEQEHMDDEDEGEWKHPPSWSDDSSTWVNSKAGDASSWMKSKTDD